MSKKRENGQKRSRGKRKALLRLDDINTTKVILKSGNTKGKQNQKKKTK